VHDTHPQACANCSTPLQGEFCHQCGQHAHNPVRSFVHAVEEVFESFWHLDGRIFRTLRRLLAPGRLARDYLQGRRAPYVAPMRLFVVLCVLTFFVGRGVIHFGNEPGADGAAVTVQTADAGIAQARSVEEVERLRAQRVDELARARDELPAYLAPVRGGFDRTIATLHEQADARVRELGGTSQPRPAADAGPEPQGWLAAQDLRIRRNLARLQEDPELLKHAFLSSMPSALFLLVPVFALLLKLAYLGSGRLYLEHLVVALFSHAFLCLALLGQMLLALLSRWSAGYLPVAAVGLDLAALALWLWMPAYLLLMQKRVYAQGWPATLLRFVAVGAVYSALMALAVAAVFVLSLARL